MLEQQIYFIDMYPCVSSQSAVADDTVEDAVQHHQHPHRLELLAQIPNVVTDDPGIGVHIGGFGKGVQAALREQFDGQRHISGLRLVLPEQFRVEITESGRAALIPAPDVVPVDLGGAAVDDGFLLGGQAPLAHELLTQGQEELGFQYHRVLSVPVALLHVHGVDVVG